MFRLRAIKCIDMSLEMKRLTFFLEIRGLLGYK